MKCNVLLWSMMILLLESVVNLCTVSDFGSGFQEPKSKNLIHSRKRRYVVFPEGSALTVAADVTVPVLTNARTIFTTGTAWALSYDLPNETIHSKNNEYEFPVMIRRHKRDLYVRIEKLMDSSGIGGKNCILKTICETSQKTTAGQGILEEVLRILFTYPYGDETKKDSKSSKEYVEAHGAGTSGRNCDHAYPCPISLLELGLGFGKYQES